MLQLNEFSDDMAFYGTFHRNPVNQLIHFIFIPLILWSGILFFAHIPLPLSYFIKDYKIAIGGFIPPHRITYATLIVLTYTIFYFAVDPFGAAFYTPLLALMYTTAVKMVAGDQTAARKKSDDAVVSWVGTTKCLKIAAAVQLVSWYMQIHPGHYVYEGAQPAILTSLSQSLSIAPLFGFYEGLWYLGIRRVLKDEVLTLVMDKTRSFCVEGVVMRACEEFSM